MGLDDGSLQPRTERSNRSALIFRMCSWILVIGILGNGTILDESLLFKNNGVTNEFDVDDGDNVGGEGVGDEYGCAIDGWFLGNSILEEDDGDLECSVWAGCRRRGGKCGRRNENGAYVVVVVVVRGDDDLTTAAVVASR